ncbi:hypothetical protein [Salinispira pacifica]
MNNPSGSVGPAAEIERPAAEPFRLKQRDRQSIELKFRYMLDREQGGREHDYDVSIYFFFPYSFNINAGTYERNSFYDDLKLYLRFNTPVLKTSELLDPESDVSPLVRIEQMIERARKGEKPLPAEECIYEGKLLGCIYKSLLRDLFGRLAAEDPAGPHARPSTIVSALKGIRAVARRYHRAAGVVVRKMSDVEPRVVQHIRMIDEHLSLLIEKYAGSLYQKLRSTKSRGPARYLSRIIAREIQYRERVGLPTVIRGKPERGKLEEYIYREKMLKRYASEVLFFDVRRRNTGKGMEQILYAAAAGIAMIFATSIAFVGQSTFGSLTTSLFLLLVVSYMLKDRLKDFFKEAFRKSLSGRFFDRTARLYDSRRHDKLATVRERTIFVPRDRADPEVLALRDRGTFEEALAGAAGESIFQYRKRITLNTRTMLGIHRRIRGVADISIIDLGSFLRHLAAQSGLVPELNAKSSVKLRPVKRIYHLNLIVRMQSGSTVDLHRYRLIVNANGIERIEPVGRREISV